MSKPKRAGKATVEIDGEMVGEIESVQMNPRPLFLVLRHPHRLSPEAMERLRAELQSVADEAQSRVLILSEGMTLDIVHDPDSELVHLRRRVAELMDEVSRARMLMDCLQEHGLSDFTPAGIDRWVKAGAR